MASFGAGPGSWRSKVQGTVDENQLWDQKFFSVFNFEQLQVFWVGDQSKKPFFVAEDC